MKVLFVGSEQLRISGPMFALDRMGHEVGMYPKYLEGMKDNEEDEQKLEDFLKESNVDFVMSVVFSRETARATNRLGIKYVVWNMDSPAYPAWVPEADYENCYLFYFDRRECELKKRSGQQHAYHLPLAADTVTSNQLVITDEEIKKYGCDISFIGGLYTQNAYDEFIGRFSAEQKNDFSEMIENSAFVWDGRDRIHMTPELVQTVKKLCPDMYDEPHMPDDYLLQTFFVERKLTHVERTLLIELLSERYDIHLYTRDTEQVPEGVRKFPAIMVEESQKVFYSSKINLNITLRSIASGVPLRIFDVMSVGGFMLSNWQEEIPELFVEDREIVTFKTPEELVDKADYYLKHENERVRIGVNGYLKIKEQHTFEQRLCKIISIIQGKE